MSVSEVATAPIAAGSLVAGYLVARETGVRPLGGGVLVAAGLWCTKAWSRRGGPRTATALLGVYGAAFAGSHPLAKRIGAWPAVLSCSAAAGGAAWALSDRRRAPKPSQASPGPLRRARAARAADGEAADREATARGPVSGRPRSSTSRSATRVSPFRA